MSDSLSALFAGGNGKPPADDLDALFALPDSEPLPAGTYAVELASGKIGASKSGKQRYELRCRVADGPAVGRAIFDDWYLSPSAWWKTGPMLKKIGIDSADKLRRELPGGLLAEVKLDVEEFEGTSRNKIRDIRLTGRKPPETPAPPTPAPDPFAPSANGESEGGGHADKGDAWEGDQKWTDEQTQFPFGSNVGPYGGGDRR